ncbi:MAG: hypothetical protein KJO72_11290 [Gammaproteobacteria bacterium]|nr:hypothetical protein [Gammaproteobacteria bacterium]MBT8057508.1 hypothetical protein [Gammaproteobacteria bacterium]
MKLLTRSILPALISSALATSAVLAQEAEQEEIVVPGLYVTTDEGRTFLQQGDVTIEMKAGESGFADEEGMRRIERLPQALDWPCSGTVAMGRKFATYTFDDLQDDDRPAEVSRRYFEIPEVIEPIPNWIDGEYHETFSVDELLQFSSPEYWYFVNPDQEYFHLKRPTTLLISMYVGITTAIIDNNAFDLLRESYGEEEIPVVFLFNDSNTVPVSYFGDNVSLEEVFTAFTERGIKLASPPMWWLGDYHLTPTIAEFEKFFDIPAAGDIPPEAQDKLSEDLATHGFTRKPIIVSVLAESGIMTVDQPRRVRMAAEMGITRVPTVINFVEMDSVVARCGPGTPTGFGAEAISGESTPEPGATVSPAAPAPPPPAAPEPPASPS